MQGEVPAIFARSFLLCLDPASSLFVPPPGNLSRSTLSLRLAQGCQTAPDSHTERFAHARTEDRSIGGSHENSFRERDSNATDAVLDMFHFQEVGWSVEGQYYMDLWSGASKGYFCIA